MPSQTSPKRASPRKGGKVVKKGGRKRAKGTQKRRTWQRIIQYIHLQSS